VETINRKKVSMEYHGKLYGSFGHKYFDTGKTTVDYNKLESEKQELVSQLKKLYDSIDSCIDLTPELLIETEQLIKKHNDGI
jgi:hypothetical protein